MNTAHSLRMSRKHQVLDSECVKTINNASRSALHSLEPKAVTAKCLQGRFPNALQNEPNTAQENRSSQGLESWEGVSPFKSDLAPSLPVSQVPVASTTQHRRRGYRKPLHVVKHKAYSPLPPSSPPESSPQVKNSVEPLQDSWGAGDIDPFGFFAAERRLKARKPAIPSRIIPKGSVEGYSFSEGDSFVGEASTVQAKHVLCDEETEPSFLFRRKRSASDIPSISSKFSKGSSEPSSPCQRVARRKSDAYKEKKAKAKKARKNPKLVTMELEALLPKRPRGRVRQQVPANRNENGKIRTRKETDTTKRARADVLSHLAEEAREKFERERQDRLRYYRKLDTYRIAKENVWIV